MNARNISDKIKSLFPDNTVEGVHVSESLVSIRFSDDAAFAAGYAALRQFRDQTAAFNNSVFAILPSPALSNFLENDDLYNNLKKTISSDYQIKTIEFENERKSQAAAMLHATPKPERKKAESLVEKRMDDLVRDILPGHPFKFVESPKTASTPYESYRLKLNPDDFTDVDKIKKFMADNGIPDVIIKYATSNNVRFPIEVIVDKKHVEAFTLFQKGLEDEKNGNLAQAVQAYTKASELGHVKAKTNLALYYLEGKGSVKQDKWKALSLLTEAATAGHPRAQFNLATMLEKGEVGTRDLVQARSWFSEAEKNGMIQASQGVNRLDKELRHYDAIAKLFPNGVERISFRGDIIIVEFNEDQMFHDALKIFKDKGHLYSAEESRNNTMFLHVTPRLIEELENKDKYDQLKQAVAAIYTVDKQPPAQKKNDDANKALEFYTKGMSEDRKLNGGKAADYYQQAVNLGHVDAKEKLAFHFLLGTGGAKQNEKTAFALYAEAAKAGHPKAQFNLATLFESGRGVEENLQQAKHWYEQALKNGISFAKDDIARIDGKLSSPAVIETETISKQVTSRLESPQSKTQSYTIERTMGFFNPANYESAKKVLETAGWTVPDLQGKNANTPIVVTKDKEKFSISPGKFTTDSTNQSTFEAMLQAFKASNPDVTPVITTNNEENKEVWINAYKQVYKDKPAPTIVIENSVPSQNKGHDDANRQQNREPVESRRLK